MGIGLSHLQPAFTARGGRGAAFVVTPTRLGPFTALLPGATSAGGRRFWIGERCAARGRKDIGGQTSCAYYCARPCHIWRSWWRGGERINAGRTLVKKSIIRLSRGKIPPVALEGPPALSSRQNGGCTQALASPPHKTETHSKQPRSRRGLTPASASKKKRSHSPCENPAPSATWVLGPPGPALAGPLTPRIGPPRPTGTPVGVPLTPPTPHPPAPLRGGAVPSVSGARPARDTHHPRRGAAGGR